MFKKIVRWSIFGIACLITLLALVVAEENWRAKHAWETFKREWEAKGERFDRASVVPPAVPDDQNFALTPIVASCYLRMLDKSGHQIQPENASVVNRLKMDIGHSDSPTNGTGNWQKSTVSDLKTWQDYYRTLVETTNAFPVPAQPQSPAADVLLALSKYDPAIEELRQASKLSYSRFPLEYDKDDTPAILLPHLAALKGCARVLQLRAIAELQNGQNDKALEDVKLALRLMDSMRAEPFLISHLVRIAMVNIELQPVWEGLAEHKWSDAQLTELDRELAKLDFLADYKLSMRGELALFQSGIFDWLRHQPKQLANISGDADSSSRALGRFFSLIPSCWFYQSQLHCARAMVELIIPAADVNQGIVSPAAARRAAAGVEADIKRTTPYNILEKMLLPALDKAMRRFASAQSSVDSARVAIALERYRLAHGAYPESLDTLARQFIAKLPHDVINGEPLKYHRTDDGRFVLYSVGWNETDDGGEVGLKEGGGVDMNTGDWVWRYPAKSSAP
jgi:tetratricopeptide (TPR) repeat protein